MPIPYRKNRGGGSRIRRPRKDFQCRRWCLTQSISCKTAIALDFRFPFSKVRVLRLVTVVLIKTVRAESTMDSNKGVLYTPLRLDEDELLPANLRNSSKKSKIWWLLALEGLHLLVFFGFFTIYSMLPRQHYTQKSAIAPLGHELDSCEPQENVKVSPAYVLH